MRLVVDMNLSPRWVALLAEAGIEAEHWASVGDHAATDAEVMAYAAGRDAVVLTHDLDFSAILAAAGSDRPSVAQIRAGDLSPEAIGKQVVTALMQMADELAAGALISIEPGRTRLRLLPLRR